MEFFGLGAGGTPIGMVSRKTTYWGNGRPTHHPLASNQQQKAHQSGLFCGGLFYIAPVMRSHGPGASGPQTRSKKTRTKTVNTSYEWATRRFSPPKPLLGVHSQTEHFMFVRLLWWLVRQLIQSLIKWFFNQNPFNWP